MRGQLLILTQTATSATLESLKFRVTGSEWHPHQIQAAPHFRQDQIPLQTNVLPGACGRAHYQLIAPGIKEVYEKKSRGTEETRRIFCFKRQPPLYKALQFPGVDIREFFKTRKRRRVAGKSLHDLL